MNSTGPFLPVGRLAAVLLLLFPASLPAQPPAPSGAGKDSAGASADVTVADEKADQGASSPGGAPFPAQDSAEALRSVLDSIELVREDIARIRSRLRAAGTAEESEIREELVSLNQRLDSLRYDFESIATGIDPAEYEETLGAEFQLRDELDTLLEPIISELKSLTETPREIEQLRSEVHRWEKRLATTKVALQNLEKLPRDRLSEEVLAALDETTGTWNERRRQAENRIQAIQYQLEQAESTQPSFLETAGDGLRSFYRSRGRNFLLCILAFFATFFFLRYLHQKFDRHFPWNRRRRRPFYLRLVDVGLNLFSVIGAVAAAILTLYATGDWVLMGLAIIILIGVALAAKNALPRFYEHARLLLNLGEIREGERVVYNGIPWKVERLSFYTLLRNEDLRGGLVRLPVNQLAGLVSRPISEEGELWFPCREGNWIDLPDEGKGRVIAQTPEYVQLVKLGGAKVTVPTADFLSKSPMNLSPGFRISIIFGLDYQHQAICTTEIPEKLWAHIILAIRKLIEDRELLLSLKVEFAAAGPSSLDYEIIADFDGALAPKFQVLSRAIQRFAVDCCNENGWVIPFTQITLHNAYETVEETPEIPEEEEGPRLP